MFRHRAVALSAATDCVALRVDYDLPEIEMLVAKNALGLFDRGKNWPSNLLDSRSRPAKHDPNRLTCSSADSTVLVDRQRQPPEHMQRVQHDCDCAPLRHCAQSGNVARTDKSQHCGRYGTIRFCTLDDVVGCAIRACHGQIDIFRRIYIRQPPRTDDTIRFCI